MILKIFITGDSSIDKLEIAKKITERNDDLSIAPKFINDASYKDITGDDYVYFMDNVDIDLSYKNNAFLYVSTNSYATSGITLDNFYNNDIFCVDIYDFNSISDYVIYSYDTLVIWVDTRTHEKMDEEHNSSVTHLIERINELNSLYFLDEPANVIVDTIMMYLNGTVEERQRILEENC